MRPEVAVVLVRSLLSGDGKGLAGEASTDKIDSSKPTQSVCVNPMDVTKAGNVRPVFAKYGLAELISLAEGNGTHAGSLESETESANSAEQIKDTHHSPCVWLDAILA